MHFSGATTTAVGGSVLHRPRLLRILFDHLGRAFRRTANSQLLRRHWAPRRVYHRCGNWLHRLVRGRLVAGRDILVGQDFPTGGRRLAGSPAARLLRDHACQLPRRHRCDSRGERHRHLPWLRPRHQGAGWAYRRWYLERSVRVSN